MKLVFNFLSGFILMASLVACQSSLAALMPATVTPIPTPTATATATSTPSPTPTPDPSFEAGLPLVARVNGEPIFLATYQAELRAITTTISRHGVDLTTQDGQQIEQQVLDGLINRLLMEQQAQKLGITITTEALQTHLAEFSPDQLATWQTMNRLSHEELTTTLTFELMVNRLSDQITHDVQPESQPQKFADWLSNQRNSAKIDLYLATPNVSK